MSNTVTRTYPRGFDAEVFSFGALEKAFLEAKAGYEREHVTPYIYERMPASAYLSDGDSSSYRVTVDTAEDLRLVREIFKELSGLEFIMWHDVVALLKRRPDLASINSGVKQKAVRTI
jgi:spore coat polysaccharide biosynthesis protein SpsF